MPKFIYTVKCDFIKIAGPKLSDDALQRGPLYSEGEEIRTTER
jgi:hypothetical protein